MTMRRALLGAGLAMPAIARAQGEPRRIIVTFPPGSSTDGLARLLADRAQREGGGAVVVENRAGAAGNIGGRGGARARPDGRTVLLTLDTLLTVNPHLYPELGFDPSALVPIALPASFPLVLLVHPGSGFSDVAGLLSEARRAPVFYASAGNGAPGHLAMEHLRQVAGLPKTAFEHVPVRGNAEAVQAVLAGTVPAGFLAIAGGPGLVRDGRLRAIACSGPRRAAGLPDVPTVAESGYPGFDVRIAILLLAPAGTPREATASWSALLTATLADAAVAARIAGWGLDPEHGDAAAAAAWITANHARWGTVVRTAEMRAE